MEILVVMYLVAVCNVHTIKSRWARTISTVYLIAIGWASFIYTPFIIFTGENWTPHRVYLWPWNKRIYFASNGLLASQWDYPRVGLELIGLTAAMGVVLLVGWLVRSRKAKT